MNCSDVCEGSMGEAGWNHIQHSQHWHSQWRVLFPIYTNVCTSADSSVKILKFADYMTVIGLIHDDKSAYRQAVSRLMLWCSRNDLEWNPLQMVDFRKNPPSRSSFTILNDTVTVTESWSFLRITICQEVGDQCSFHRKGGATNDVHLAPAEELLCQLSRAVFESILYTSTTVWL